MVGRAPSAAVSTTKGNVGVAIVYALTIDDELRSASHFADGVWDVEDAPCSDKTFDAGFVAVKGGIGLYVVDREFAGDAWLLFRK